MCRGVCMCVFVCVCVCWWVGVSMRSTSRCCKWPSTPAGMRPQWQGRHLSSNPERESLPHKPMGTAWQVALWLLVKWATVRSFTVIIPLTRLRPAFLSVLEVRESSAWSGCTQSGFRNLTDMHCCCAQHSQTDYYNVNVHRVFNFCILEETDGQSWRHKQTKVAWRQQFLLIRTVRRLSTAANIFNAEPNFLSSKTFCRDTKRHWIQQPLWKFCVFRPFQLE